MPTKNNLSATELVDRIGKILLSKNQTVAVAESVTAGDLQFQFSQGENARKYFEGGITTYSITQKTKHLHVDPVHALAANCVSEIVSCEMSMNVVTLFMTDWGIGITGYAAPVPEKSIENTFAFYSIHHKKEEVAKGRIDVENNSPSETQKEFTIRLLAEFLKVLKK
jgi:PncC family amidohydrolase